MRRILVFCIVITILYLAFSGLAFVQHLWRLWNIEQYPSEIKPYIDYFGTFDYLFIVVFGGICVAAIWIIWFGKWSKPRIQSLGESGESSSFH